MHYSKQTYIYKIVQDCPLHADVYRSETGGRKTGILWIHGGGLIFGNRGMLPVEQMELYLAAGYTIISIDYRLAPETKLKGILEDVQDAYYWVNSKGPDLFGVDPNSLIVIGHSAGGYLALMTGFSVYPRPKALVSFYGYGDITGEGCSRPDPHYTKESIVSPEIAYEGVGGSVITGSQFIDFKDKRWLFYLFCRQQGLWLKEISGYDLLEVPEMFDSFCPVRHVTQDYPPTLLLHGDQDTDVSVELSKQMAASLKQNHVTHRLIIIEGLGHMFDIVPDTLLEGAPARLHHPKVVEAFNAVLAFLTHLTQNE